ncbi:glycosylase [Isosphaeraceae bacterium EP7]
MIRSRPLARTLAAFLLVGSIGQAAIAQVIPFPRDFVSWTPRTQGAVFKGTGASTWDNKIRERGFILVEDGTYHLWYTGYNDSLSPTRMLGHATSPDGLTWTRDPANPLLTSLWVEDVCVVKQDGTYYMFAEGKGDIAHLLTSTDRIHWTEQGPLKVLRKDGTPITAGPYGTPTIWVEGGVWYLFYERGDRGVWLATSKDRKTWVNVQDEPVLAMGPEAYDLHAVAMNQIIKRDGFYYTFYHANATLPWRDWTSNVARSRDLIHWEKYAGNPIAANNSSSPILVESGGKSRLYTMHPEIRAYEPAASK